MVLKIYLAKLTEPPIYYRGDKGNKCLGYGNAIICLTGYLLLQDI